MKKSVLMIVVCTVLIAALVIGLNHFDIIGGSSKEDKDSKKESKLPPKGTVCIDAGHGFADVGCESPYFEGYEKDVTIKIAKFLKKELESRNIKVILTHDGKKFPTCKEILKGVDKYDLEYDSTRLIENNNFSAYERVIYANVVNETEPIDLLVSLHINSIENHSELSQYELYYYENNPHAQELKALCKNLENDFDNDTKTTATAADESYTITRYTDYPSLLIEMGYATNREDARKLNDGKWRKEYAKTLAEQIEDFVDK